MNNALGAIFGAFIGDSIGSVLDFGTGSLEEALEMQGFGDRQPGQATDDSEMATCLIKGLLEGSGVLDLEPIAKYYKMWVQTAPVDIGNTCKAALQPLVNIDEGYARTARTAASESNQRSLSNGSFMRCTPLAVWGHKLGIEDLTRAVSLEVSLTHPNPTVQAAEACYVLAIVHLINHHGDRDGAYLRAKELGSEVGCDWFYDIENSDPMDPETHPGFAKIAFDHAFRHLKNGTQFEEAIRQALVLGGDIDTNGAIIGGLIGAAIGFDCLPEDWKNKVMGADGRADFLDQKLVYQQVVQLFEMAPGHLEVNESVL